MLRRCTIPCRYGSVVATLVALAAGADSAAAAVAPGAPAVISQIDLSKAFATRSPWRFVATQGPPIQDPIMGSGAAPGSILLCVRAATSTACDPQLRSTSPDEAAAPVFADFHYLDRAEIVRPFGAAGRPLLFVQTRSLRGGNGGQIISTQVLGYRRSQDRFARVYDRWTGSNNNQETRYISAGPLRGDIVSVEPTGHAPFRYWVSVSAPRPGETYRETLRYRSATGYNDGDTLAVIDSEMPNIERRLGVRRRGAALPLPAGPCPRPHLIRNELWCASPADPAHRTSRNAGRR